MHLLAKEVSKFNEMTVFETTQLFGEMGRFRCLQFADTAIQGAIDLKNPKRIMLSYQRAVVQLMGVINSLFYNVFVIGHGIGTIANHYADRPIKVAELDEKVVELSKLYFGYRRNNVVLGDGRDLLMNEEENTFDYIVLDAFTHKGTPLHFITKEFFTMTIEKLTSRGAIIMNLMGKTNNDRVLNAIYTTLREVYRYSRAFSLLSEHEADSRNIIIIGSNKTLDFQARDIAGIYEIELEEGHIIIDA